MWGKSFRRRMTALMYATIGAALVGLAAAGYMGVKLIANVLG